MRGCGFDRLSHGLCSRHETRHMPRLRLAPLCSHARFRVAVAELGVVRLIRALASSNGHRNLTVWQRYLIASHLIRSNAEVALVSGGCASASATFSICSPPDWMQFRFSTRCQIWRPTTLKRVSPLRAAALTTRFWPHDDMGGRSSFAANRPLDQRQFSRHHSAVMRDWTSRGGGRRYFFKSYRFPGKLRSLGKLRSHQPHLRCEDHHPQG